MQSGILAMARSGGNATLISIITSSQVNASLCSLQYALNEQQTFAPLVLMEPPSKHRNWYHRKTFFSFKILIHDFRKQNNSFYHNSIYMYAANIDIDDIIIGIAQQLMLISRVTNHL